MPGPREREREMEKGKKTKTFALKKIPVYQEEEKKKKRQVSDIKGHVTLTHPVTQGKHLTGSGSDVSLLKAGNKNQRKADPPCMAPRSSCTQPQTVDGEEGRFQQRKGNLGFLQKCKEMHWHFVLE